MCESMKSACEGERVNERACVRASVRVRNVINGGSYVWQPKILSTCLSRAKETCSLPGLYTLAYTKVRGYDVEVERNVEIRAGQRVKRGPERRLAAVIDAASM